MIRLRVKEEAESIGIVDAAELSRRTGIAYDTAYRLWRGDVGGVRRGDRSVGIVTLYRVAKALGVRTSDLYLEDDRLTRLLAGVNLSRTAGLRVKPQGWLAPFLRFAL